MPDEKYVPLIMGDRVIGVINFNTESGVISGKLESPEFSELLTECFAEGLTEVAFYAKPTVPMPQVQARVADFLKGTQHQDQVAHG